MKMVPYVGEERQYWAARRASSVSLGIFAVQSIPKSVYLHFFENQPLRILYNRKQAYAFVDQKVRGLSKLNRIQANCLGLLARPKTILPDLANSRTDLSSYMETMRDPLERYIHHEISLLEDVCGSLEHLHLPSQKLSESFDASLFVHIAVARLDSVAERFQTSTQHFQEIMTKYQRPSVLEQYWLPATVGGLGLLFVHKQYTFSALASQLQNLVVTARETLTSFAQRWIISPCMDIFKTIRHKEPRLAIMGAKSLTSDLDVSWHGSDCSPWSAW
ncbi:hypothetical protein HDU91_002989 [Kappamyces sp. JEL0680]|nr:hypothetical protein HDU91_002989 [Kappamyces sp. JEL0680]